MTFIFATFYARVQVSFCYILYACKYCYKWLAIATQSFNNNENNSNTSGIGDVLVYFLFSLSPRQGRRGGALAFLSFYFSGSLFSISYPIFTSLTDLYKIPFSGVATFVTYLNR